MATARSWSVSLVFFLGLVLLYVGERLFAAGSTRVACSAAGVLLIVASVAWRLMRVSAAKVSVPTRKATDVRDRTQIEKALLGLQLVGVLGLFLYAAQSDLMARLLDKPLDQVMPRFAVVLAALWPLCLATSLMPLLFAELSYAGMVRAPMVESARVKEAMFSGLGLTFALVFAFTVVYVATERDVKWDFSHFRTSRPGTATRNALQTQTEPVEVYAFFPPANEVREQVEEYLTDLQKDAPQLKVEFLDHAVDPTRARELSVSGNGALVIARGKQREQMTLSLELEGARAQLRTLDQDFQKRLLKIIQGKRVVYFTTGHGERNEDKVPGAEGRSGVASIKELIANLNMEVRNLSAAEGLATDVPKDARAVFLLGPTKPLLPEEAASLVRFVKGGGRLFAAVDPEATLPFDALFAPLGVRFLTTTLANDQVYLKRTAQLSDRANIATASFTSHPAVTTLGQLGRAPIGLFGAGSFEVIQPKPAELQLETTVRSHAATFNDVNGNFNQDPPLEVRKAYDLEVTVASKPEAGQGADKEGRAVLLADSDAVSDALLTNAGNAYLVLDAVKWLSGDEAIAGTVSSETDVPLEHTRKQDVAWFYSTIFAAPAALLALGFALTRRRRPRARPAVAAPAAQGGAR